MFLSKSVLIYTFKKYYTALDFTNDLREGMIVTYLNLLHPVEESLIQLFPSRFNVGSLKLSAAFES